MGPVLSEFRLPRHGATSCASLFQKTSCDRSRNLACLPGKARAAHANDPRGILLMNPAIYPSRQVLPSPDGCGANARGVGGPWRDVHTQASGARRPAVFKSSKGAGSGGSAACAVCRQTNSNASLPSRACSPVPGRRMERWGCSADTSPFLTPRAIDIWVST